MTNYWTDIYDYTKNTEYSMWRSKFIADVMAKNANQIDSILELGCNTGCNLLEIHKVAPNIKLSGIEINPKAVEYGKTIEGNTADMVVGNILDLSQFKDKSFDLILTAGVLMYFKPKTISIIIDEILRISKKFVFSIERSSKRGRRSSIIQTDRHGDCKISISEFRYDLKYKRLGYDIDICPMQKVLPGIRIKNNRHLIVTNLTEQKLIM